MKISVVIPCRNEALYIEECIQAIYSSKDITDVSLNVFVVDGMSDDGTREIVEKLTETFPTLKLVDNKKQLTPFAFNLGIYETACDYVQIVGARHIISDNYLSNCLLKLNENPAIWCVGGKIINEYLNDTGKIIAKAMSTSLGMGLGNFRTLQKSGFTDTVTSPMYPYWVFEKIGFFDEELIRNQDDDFNFRVTNAGGKIYYCNDISLKYYVRGNYKNLWKQFFQYGYWKVYVNKKHKAVTTLRQLVPPLFVFYLLYLPFSFLIGTYWGLFSLIPLFLYIVLAKIVAWKNASSFKEFINILKTFPILHISYGLGYLNGILDFLLLNKKPSEKNKKMSR